MTTEIGHGSFLRRIAINVGAGFVPGMNAVMMGAALAAGRLGWEMVGIRDGFDGLLHPERYPDGGLVTLNPQLIENLDPAGGGILGQSARVDPFNVRQVNEDDMVEEVDMSDELLQRLKAEKIDALISVVGGRGLSILYKLHRKGLNTVCIPRSIENDIAATIGVLRVQQRAQLHHRNARPGSSGGPVGPQDRRGGGPGRAGRMAGAAGRHCRVRRCGADSRDSLRSANGGRAVEGKGDTQAALRAGGGGRRGEVRRSRQAQADKPAVNSLKASLSPLATGEASEHVIQRSGQAAETVATRLQLLIAEETYPLVLGPWVRGGAPTAVDRQLGLAYGAGAVRALNAGKNGVMMAFVPPDIKFVPLAEAINKVRTVPADSVFMQIAQSLGICLGREAMNKPIQQPIRSDRHRPEYPALLQP